MVCLSNYRQNISNITKGIEATKQTYHTHTHISSHEEGIGYVDLDVSGTSKVRKNQ